MNDSDPTGSVPTGNVLTGSDPTGNDPTGSVPSGSVPTGSVPTGNDPARSVPTESVPTGSVPNTLVDLPTSLDIEVQVVSPGAAEKDKLHDNTQDLYTRFDPSSAWTLQVMRHMLHSCISWHPFARDMIEMDGLHLEIPNHQQPALSTVDAQGDENAVQLDTPYTTPSLATVPGLPSLNS